MQLAPHQLLTGKLPWNAHFVLPAACLMAPVTAAVVFTQILAKVYAFDPALGPPWAWALPRPLLITECVLLLVVGLMLQRWLSAIGWFLVLPFATALLFLDSGPLYSPLRGFYWGKALLVAGMGWGEVLGAAVPALITLVCTVAVGYVVQAQIRRRYHPSHIAHGSARYAEVEDLRRAGLLAGDGVYLGVFPHRGRELPITDDSQHHTLFVMPSGAGKSAGHIIPSLLTRSHSAFVLDPKGELYDATAGWRAAQGHRILRLAPLEGLDKADRWNPLLEIERGPEDTGVLGLLAEALVVSSAVEDSHWDEMARALFRCLALHSLYTGDPPSLHHVRALLHYSDGLEEVFGGIEAAVHDPESRFRWQDPETGNATQTHPEAALLARGFLGTPDREMGSIASTLRRALALWGDPRMVASTAASDFDLGVFNGEEPVTLYAVVPYSDLHRLAPWVRILLALLVRRITHFRNVESAPPLDLFLDEFASLGRVKVIHQILSFLRGYGVRAHLVIQSYDDLERLYGRGENISACQTHVVAATQSRGSRRFISDLAGEATVQWERRSHSGGRVQPLPSRENRSPTETRRPLITQGEVGTLGADEILIAKTGLPLIRAKKHFYFRDRELAARAAMLPPARESRPSQKEAQVPLVGVPKSGKPKERRNGGTGLEMER